MDPKEIILVKTPKQQFQFNNSNMRIVNKMTAELLYVNLKLLCKIQLQDETPPEILSPALKDEGNGSIHLFTKTIVR